MIKEYLKLIEGNLSLKLDIASSNQVSFTLYVIPSFLLYCLARDDKTASDNKTASENMSAKDSIILMTTCVLVTIFILMTTCLLVITSILVILCLLVTIHLVQLKLTKKHSLC